MKKLSDIGLIGLAVMGENLALNMEGKGFQVSLYNREHPGRVNPVVRFTEGRGKGKNFLPTKTVEEFVQSIERPRRIMLMIKAGEPVDSTMDQLIPFMEAGDIIIDGGNSDFHDTERRVKKMEEKGLLFVGTGVSGGEEGALNGPSIMPGGSEAAWPRVRTVLEKIAAQNDDGTPCCAWMGKGGAGHYVKMVHNGIEYGDMQLISEAYLLLKDLRKKDNAQMAEIFSNWNKTELDSYLIEITAQILKYKDKDGGYLLDKILDAAGQKGTGKWTVMAALDEADPLSLITQAVYARFISAQVDLRQQAAKKYDNQPDAGWEMAAPEPYLKDALYASKIVSYAQGFSLLRAASLAYEWKLDFASIARIWRKGCIIRSVFLNDIARAYEKNSELENLLFDEFFKEKINAALTGWRRAVAAAVLSGIAIPCTAAAVNYFDTLRSARGGANLIQAQRDFFGAHTYERVDAPRGEFFHTDWAGLGGDVTSGTYNA